MVGLEECDYEDDIHCSKDCTFNNSSPEFKAEKSFNLAYIL